MKNSLNVRQMKFSSPLHFFSYVHQELNLYTKSIKAKFYFLNDIRQDSLFIKMFNSKKKLIVFYSYCVDLSHIYFNRHDLRAGKYAVLSKLSLKLLLQTHKPCSKINFFFFLRFKLVYLRNPF